MAAEKKREAETRSEWDRSTVNGDKKMSAEDRIASKIANEVLRDNAKLRGVHSGNSIKKLLEREAKKQLLVEQGGGSYNAPVMSVVMDRGEKAKADPSNLPYLHKCPAV